MRLESKVALVTGGASGIGRATAERFAVEGATVFVADINDEAAEEVASAIGGFAVHLDVTSQESAVACAERVRRRVGRLDILVNNAGKTVVGTVAELAEADWDHQMDVNLKSVYLVSKALWSLLVEANGAAVVNTASVAGSFVVPGEAAYSASKAGVVMLTRAAALEGAKSGIRVNCVSPGVIVTPMIEEFAASQPDPDAVRDTTIASVPLARLGSPSDIANVILFLASDEAAYVTAAEIVVDGGWTAGFWGLLENYP